jgi:2',3'-cyclic-nucleotide 2'-phosphodiesterase (5'-nucleotidase family)
MARLIHHSDLENVYDAPGRAGRLAGRIRALDGPEALVCGTGDDLAPGVLALVERGRQALPFFEAAGTAVETFGNHDFDFGTDRTLGVVRDSDVTWLSANVRRGGERFGADAGVLPHDVRDVGGTRVGFFGVTDPRTGSLNPKAAELELRDPYDSAAEATAALRRRGADYVVALSHLGAGDEELATRVDVDAVLGGHVHSRRATTVDGTPLTRPGAGGHAVAEIDLDAGEARLHEVGDAPVVDAVAEPLRGRTAAAGLDERVATAPVPMPRDEATVFGGECRVGNFVADAFRAAADADVGLANSGGIRAGPPLDGAVTRADLVSLLPFEEPLVVAEVTGGTLRDVLAQAAGATLSFGEEDWWHAHLSGVRAVYDATTGEPAELRVAGEPLDEDALYEVATGDYLLHTDHEFPALETRHRAGELGIQHEELTAYAREHGVAAPVEGRVRLVDRHRDGKV